MARCLLLRRADTERKQIMQDKVKMSVEEKKNLYRRFQDCQWRMVQCRFRTLSVMMQCMWVGYCSEMPWLSRMISRFCFSGGIWAYWFCVRQFRSIIRQSGKDMKVLDALIAQRCLKPIERPAKFESPKLWSVLMRDPENFSEALSAAQDVLNSKIDDWVNAYELMARQMKLLRDNKDDISAVDDLKREEDENRQKEDAERKACKTATLPKGGAGGTLTLQWEEFRDAPFKFDRVKEVVSFGGMWYVETYEDEVWRSGDCVRWERVEVPIKSVGDLCVVGEALILWSGDRQRYAYTFDGNGWNTAEVKCGGAISSKRIIRFGGKWLLAVRECEDCTGVKGRGVFKRKVKLRSDKTRFYVTDDLAGGWSEIEKMRTEDGWYILPDDIAVSDGKLYAQEITDITYWKPLKKVEPEPRNVYISEVESGWRSTSLCAQDVQKMVRFGDYGCKVNLSGEWMRLTSDGVTYRKLYLGECTWRFALSEDAILKVYDRKENACVRLGRLAPVEADK